MKIKAIIASIGLTVAAAGALTVGLVSNNSNSGPKQAKAVDFSTETITRRVYFVNNDNEGVWYDTWYKYVYAYSLDESKTYMSALATTIYGSYHHGLFYADITFAGAGDSINIIITTSNTWTQPFGQTPTITIPALSSKSADCIWINNGNPYLAPAPVSAAEGKCVLDHISTCDASYASGYNAYPQINTIFDLKNVANLNGESIDDLDKDGHGGYNAYNKIIELENQYKEKGWK